jgi:pSer/pThr/pTyr-binding forkhead associated (FHA) protein
MQDQDNDKTVVGGVTLDLSYSICCEDGTPFIISDELSIGRSQECDVFIDDKKISRKHALFKLNNGRLQLEDLNSSNGSYLNGKKIAMPMNLANGDVINFEQYLYTVKIEINKNDDSQKQESVSEEPVVDENEHTAIADISIEEFNKINQAAQSHEVIDESSQKPSKPIANEKYIPGSWIEDSKAVDGTQMMKTQELKALRASVLSANEKNTNVTCLHCFIDGKSKQVIELPVQDSKQMLGWDLGRDMNCDVVLNHPSVSNKHAQIIHKNGRWKITNLVSTNGILVNGQKKLSTYLADGDKIGLGSVNLIISIPKTKNKPKPHSHNKPDRFIIPVILGLVLAILAILIFVFLI